MRKRRIAVPKYKVTKKTEDQVIEDIQKDQIQRQEIFEEELGKVKVLFEELSALDEADIGKFEERMFTQLMELGLKATEAYLSVKRQVPKPKMYDFDGRMYKYVGEKDYIVRGIFGVGSYISSLYQRGEKADGRRQLIALNSQVGILPAGGLSPNLVLELANLTTRMAYSQAREVMGYFRPYVPSQRSICGIIDMIGPHAEVVLDQLECEAGEVVEIQVDARGAPRIGDREYAQRCRPHKKRKKAEQKDGKRKRRRYLAGTKPARPRRTKGKKSKNKKRVTVGVISSLNRQPDGSWEGPFGKYIARFGSAEDVFKRLRQALDRMGPEVQKVLFYSDGDLQYAKLARKYFPKAIIVLDFYHVSEYLWKAVETLYKEGSKELAELVGQLKEMICDDRVDEALITLKNLYKSIPKRGPGTKGRRERMQKSIDYLGKRIWQMPYKMLREEGLEIGSGMIESAVKQLVALRLEGPGMKWGKHRPQLILHMLCVRLSEGWDVLVEAIRIWSHQPNYNRRLTPSGVNERKKKKASTISPEKKQRVADMA